MKRSVTAFLLYFLPAVCISLGGCQAKPVPQFNGGAGPATETPGRTTSTGDPRAFARGAIVHLVCVRGMKPGVVYPIYEGQNYIGRADQLPVDIDLDDQELPDHIWSSRQHARLNASAEGLRIEDLNSANGTYVNRRRVYPGKTQDVKVNDVIQIGSIRLRVLSNAEAKTVRVSSPCKLKLLVTRGLKKDCMYPLFEGENYMGRSDEIPADIDLDDQEAPDRVWSSRQHALIRCKKGQLEIEDLKSANGTFVNRTRHQPGVPCPLRANDIIQVGTVHMKVVE